MQNVRNLPFSHQDFVRFRTLISGESYRPKSCRPKKWSGHIGPEAFAWRQCRHYSDSAEGQTL
jgi:hypothetical protein